MTFLFSLVLKMVLYVFLVCLFVCLKEMLKINILWLVDLVGFGLFGSCPTYVYVYINC